MKLCCIADTHGFKIDPRTLDGDVLIHAGDLTSGGSLTECIMALAYIEVLGKNFKHTIIIPGNHDFAFENQPDLMKKECDSRDIILLNDSECEIDGVKFWGSPITPWFGNWAFNVQRGNSIRKVWSKIPLCDVLITHGPPYQILDGIPRYSVGMNGQSYDLGMEHVGCADLLNRIGEIKPKIHVFGHIHEAYGNKELSGTTYINASICDGMYNPVNKPIIMSVK